MSAPDGAKSQAAQASRAPFQGLQRVELLALAGGLFVISSIVLCLQPVVTDPSATSSRVVRFLSPWSADDDAVRPIIFCSLNAVDVVPPQEVWIVGNRGLVLHSLDGRSWKPVLVEGSPAPADAKAAWWPGILAVARAAPAPLRKPLRAEQMSRVDPGRYARTENPGCIDDKSSEDPSATCVDVQVSLPPGAHVLGVTGSAAEAAGSFSACDPTCAIGWSGFVGKPRVERTGVVWRFKNWSADRARTARVQVEYEAPDEETTPTPSTAAPPPVAQSTIRPASPPTPSETPPTMPPIRAGPSPEDYVGVHFAREGTPGRGWIVSRSGRVLATDDGGKSWRPAGSIAAGGEDVVAAFRATSSAIDDARTALFRSLQGSHVVAGSLWTADEGGLLMRRSPAELERGVSTDGRPIYGVFFVDADTGWAVGANGRIFSITPGVPLARPQRSGTEADLHSVAFLPDGRGWSVGAGGTVLATGDGGENWRSVSTPATERPRPWSPRLPYWFALTTLAAFGLLLHATRMEDPAEPDESIADTPGSDRPVETPREDVLDFQAVARGLSRFLRNEKTTAPLTIAVIGEWGTGKSSLMNLLRADLREFGFRSVWFNAWHHQKEEHLLAALLQTVRLQAVPPIWSPAAWGFRRRLLWIHVRRHWATVAAVLVVFGIAAGFETAHHSLWKLISLDGKELDDIAGRVPALLTDLSTHKRLGLFLASALSVIFTVFRLLRPFGVNPASLLASVSGAGRLSALEAQTSFRHLFAQEFRDVTHALGPRTMPIFIDDLDRCRPQQVVDVLEAVSFLVSSGECFVVLGMARDRVEKCVGMSFKEVAEEMSGPEGNAREARAAFARQYLDKLINIEVPIQEPTVKQSMSLLVIDPPGRSRRSLRSLATLGSVLSLGGLMALGFWLGRHLPSYEEKPATAPAAVATPAPVVSAPAATPASSRSSAPPPLRRDPSTWPPVGRSEETAEVGAAPRRPWFISYAVVWPLGFALVLVCVWVLNRRRDLVVKDSSEFRKALESWHPVVVGRRLTPRALKRFVNRLRYLAMRQRPYPPSPPLWRTLLDRLRRPSPPVAPEPVASVERIPESALVALAALEEVDPQLVRKALTAETPIPPTVVAAFGDDARRALMALEKHRLAFLRMAGRVQVN